MKLSYAIGLASSLSECYRDWQGGEAVYGSTVTSSTVDCESMNKVIDPSPPLLIRLLRIVVLARMKWLWTGRHQITRSK